MSRMTLEKNFNNMTLTIFSSPFQDNFMSRMTCGVIHPNVLDHFCAWVEGDITLILKLENNYKKFLQYDLDLFSP